MEVVEAFSWWVSFFRVVETFSMGEVFSCRLEIFWGVGGIDADKISASYTVKRTKLDHFKTVSRECSPPPPPNT